MVRKIIHHSIIALAIAPSIWLVYFVSTYLVTELGCARGWIDHEIGPLNVLELSLWTIAAIGVALIAYAAWQSWRGLQIAHGTGGEFEPHVQERRRFIAKSGFFLAALSLLGALWGVMTILLFDTCGT